MHGQNHIKFNLHILLHSVSKFTTISETLLGVNSSSQVIRALH